ncbi:MAG TPA: MarR family transcriptional regulator [Galbitalea sp.]|jgi:DNA-binding MarR family transcriptional regulator
MSSSDEEMEDSVAPTLLAASRAFTATTMAKIADAGFAGVTPAFASFLVLLDAAGARPTALAQRAGITKQAVSQLVRELEARGYVEQIPDSTDTRAKLARLTEQGVALQAACAEIKHELQSVAVEKLGTLRVARLQQDLVDLAAALDDMRMH